jgi:hypothetical protein
MILRAEDRPSGLLIDLDTGKPVYGLLWWNSETGYIEALQLDAKGRKQWAWVAESGKRVPRAKTYHARGRFKWQPSDAPFQATKAPQEGATRCARCPSPLTLPGDELCARCKAADRGKPLRVERISNPLLGVRCRECSRAAVFGVGDEVEASPQRHAGLLWDRGACVGQRWYCERHYVPPRLLDARGEVIAEQPAGNENLY